VAYAVNWIDPLCRISLLIRSLAFRFLVAELDFTMPTRNGGLCLPHQSCRDFFGLRIQACLARSKLLAREASTVASRTHAQPALERRSHMRLVRESTGGSDVREGQVRAFN